MDDDSQFLIAVGFCLFLGILVALYGPRDFK